MFIYEGANIETGEKLRKEFDHEDEAISFATDNCDRYPEFEIFDQDGIVEYNDEELESAEAIAWENYFPDEDSREGFDWTFGD